MSVETDGVEEAFEGQLRVLLTTAGQVGERLARVREDTLRRAQADSERETRELRSRVQAEQQAARAQLSGVYRPGWWEQAGPEQVASTYQLARAWSHEDPEAVRAEQHIRAEVRARYGVDLDVGGADPAAVREAVERADRARAQAGTTRGKSVAEQGETALLMAQADAAERDADRARSAVTSTTATSTTATSTTATSAVGASTVATAGPEGYDSPERRQTAAKAMVDAGVDQETVAKRMRADVSQAAPAAAATSGRNERAPRARKARGAALTPQRGPAER